MKYLEQYIEEKLKIKVLGDLTTCSSMEGECVGVSLKIDGYEPGIEVYYCDYATWLEEKIQSCSCGLNNETNENNKLKKTFEDFRDDIIDKMNNARDEKIRKGQFVFNYIDTKYGVARTVRFFNGIDCFYNDNVIEEFIIRSYEHYLVSDSKC